MKDRLTRFVRRYGVPAVGAATVDLDDARAEADVCAVGVTRRGGTSPVARPDAWHIGSCAKSLTAALYARLVERGLTAWSIPLVDLFPDLGVHGSWSRATVDDLLTCRSGLPANPTRAVLEAGYLDRREPIEQRTEAAAAALAAPPDGAGRFRYSNLGYTLAGAAIDRLAGQPFEAALSAELFRPLGVTSAGFGPPARIWGHGPRLQLGAVCVGRGRGKDPADPGSDNPPLITPAGRIHLALADWARLQRLFLDGAGVLSAASVQHLLRLPPDGRGMAMGWADASRVAGAALGMQGSNTAWAAAAMMSADHRRIAMVVTNDGRTRVLTAAAVLAGELAAARVSTARGASG